MGGLSNVRLRKHSRKLHWLNYIRDNNNNDNDNDNDNDDDTGNDTGNANDNDNDSDNDTRDFNLFSHGLQTFVN